MSMTTLLKTTALKTTPKHDASSIQDLNLIND
jgi:hypothetical protein